MRLRSHHDATTSRIEKTTETGQTILSKPDGKLEVDRQGRLVLPPEVAARLGLTPGSQAYFTLHEHELRIERPASSLARINIEPTNICNLDCATCMRNVWDEPAGQMNSATFERILAGLSAFSPLPSVFFGGYGEPLAHPQLIDMVRQVKNRGLTVELITNAILLTQEKAAQLIEAGLDTLWVSIDGATPQSYTDVRLGAALPRVIENIANLRDQRKKAYRNQTQIGVAFVAMHRNIADLPAVLQLGLELGASRFSISNVLAHTPVMREEVLYEQCLYANATPGVQPVVNLPRFDLTPEIAKPLFDVLLSGAYITLAGEPVGQAADHCPFIRKGSLSIRWDGKVCPCLPLLHTHASYLDDHERKSYAHHFGDVNLQGLVEIWESPAYQAFRDRIQAFDFSPCVLCNSCDMAETNQEDCFGNSAPTCGGCLWAHGLIQCP